MNRSGQYLDPNQLWTDEWAEAKRTIDLPVYDPAVIGHHEVFCISDIDAVGSRRPTKFQKVTDFDFVMKYGAQPDDLYRKLLAPSRIVAPSKRDAFYEEYKALCKKYEVPPFKPHVHYNVDGDQLEVYLTDEQSHQKPMSIQSPGIMVEIGMESKSVVGVKIQHFLERLAGADPSVQYMKIDLELVTTLCDMYEFKIDQYNASWIWKPEELEFFKTIRRLWPGLTFKFLGELP